MGILTSLGGAFKGVFGIISMIPSIVKVVEIVIKAIKGASATSVDKHSLAIALVREAITASEDFSGKEIADQDLFAAGLDKIVHGTVDCLNATVWHKVSG